LYALNAAKLNVDIHSNYMKKENPVCYRLKCTSVEIVSDMTNSGRFVSEKDACRYLYTQSRKKHLNTGFKLTADFEKFYNSFRKFKSKIHINSHAENSQNDIESQFTEYENYELT